MENSFQEELNRLKIENEALRDQLDGKSKRKNARRKRNLTWSWRLFAGESLFKSFNNWFQEFHSPEKVSPKTSASLLTALVRRFVRVRLISLILLLFSIIPSLVSIYILYKQNQLIKTQNSLVEGTRKSSYGFQLSNIFDAVDRQGSNIDKNLRSRITGLTYSLKPYKILEEDNKLSDRPYSPERTQLLLYIAKSSISNTDKKLIFKEADFSYCDLRNMNLSGAYLVGANLAYSNLDNAILRKTRLDEANLSNATLTNINFTEGFAKKAKFIDARLDNAVLRYTDLREAVLTNAKLNDVRLKTAILDNAYFDGDFLLDGTNDSENYIESKYIIKKDSEGFNTFTRK